MDIEVYVDGSVKKASQSDSRGKGAYRFVVINRMMLLAEQVKKEDNQTVPETEMKALVEGLTWMDNSGLTKDHDVIVKCDSELVVKWMSGEYKMRAENILPLYLNAKNLIDKLERKGFVVRIEKIRGKENLAHVEA